MSSTRKSLLLCGELGSYELANMCGLVPDSTKVLSLTMSLKTHPVMRTMMTMVMLMLPLPLRTKKVTLISDKATSYFFDNQFDFHILTLLYFLKLDIHKYSK